MKPEPCQFTRTGVGVLASAEELEGEYRSAMMLRFGSREGSWIRVLVTGMEETRARSPRSM